MQCRDKQDWFSNAINIRDISFHTAMKTEPKRISYEYLEEIQGFLLYYEHWLAYIFHIGFENVIGDVCYIYFSLCHG